jgi:hypothetical protein
MEMMIYKSSITHKEIRPDADAEFFWMDNATQKFHGKSECASDDATVVTRAQAVERFKACQADEEFYGGARYASRVYGFCPKCAVRRVGSKAGNAEAKAIRSYTPQREVCGECFMERSASGACGCIG